MSTFSRLLCVLLGQQFGKDDLVAVFSIRLDETGTDGLSAYMVVAGAVATATQWESLENSWRGLLTRANISAFHWKEFNDPNDATFGKWSSFKRKRFAEAQEKIIKRNTVFRASVGVERALHADIKKRMKGIRGFVPESDYSLCLRYLMFATCEQLVQIDSDCRLSVLVEDGPWAAGAMRTYQRVRAMTGKWKPSKHAHRLVGFGSVPKGERPSLEAADYIAGEEHRRLVAGWRPKKNTQTLSLLMNRAVLERWYQGMIGEKEARRAYHQQKFRASGAAAEEEERPS